jgi:hypothetical protein
VNAHRIEAALRSSPCPYAGRGRISILGPWDGHAITGTDLDCLADELATAAGAPADQRPDVIAMIVTERPGTDVTSLARLLRTTLDGLGRCDRVTGDNIAVGLATWDFVFAGARYFVPVFSSVYATSHPRHSALDGHGYLLFQPEWAFRRFGISSTRANRAGLSEAVRSVFAAHGIDYTIESVTQWPKALRYVKPLHEDEPPVRWWQSEDAPVTRSDQPLELHDA